mgnify:CR=1 FL=1
MTRQAEDLHDRLPVWQYMAIDDSRLGDDHRPMMGKYYPSSVTFAEVRREDDGREYDPALLMSPGEAQGLMNELWRNGIRPTSGEGNVGQIGATERHLEDMRVIAFNRLNIVATVKK